MNNIDAVIFLNGKISFKIFKKFPKIYLICADGASNKLIKLKIIPNIIIGDMDSSKTDVLDFYRNKNVEIRKIEEQETTDFEKSLMYCIENNFKNIVVFGAASRRQDHTLNNYSVLKRYYKLINIKFFDNKYEIFFIDKKISFNYPVGEIISLMPMHFAGGITTSGLKYLLKNEDLKFGVREGTLNYSDKENITIEFTSGDLLLFKKHFNLAEDTE